MFLYREVVHSIPKNINLGFLLKVIKLHGIIPKLFAQ
jgi:hypothetical protein